jgi:hypothetical protein
MENKLTVENRDSYAETCQKNSIEPQCKNARKKIEEATKKGYTHCYIIADKDRPDIQVIDMLLKDGFDIFIHTNGPHSWWLSADWHNGASGKIFNDYNTTKPTELTYNELVEMLAQ